MDTRQYQELLEDVQIDIAEAERAAAEMRSLESYIQRKLEAKGGGDNHYSDLLNDVRRDVAGADREMSELRGVESYLRRKLKGDRAGESFGGRAGAAPFGAPAADAQDVVEFEPAEAAKSKPPLKKPMPLMKPATGEKSASRPLEKSRPRPTPSGEPDAMQTVEFGPDGFPMT
jgi:hypothetical protein